jgi:hypothetical protein
VCVSLALRKQNGSVHRTIIHKSDTIYNFLSFHERWYLFSIAKDATQPPLIYSVGNVTRSSGGSPVCW